MTLPWQVAILQPETPEERQRLLDQFHIGQAMTPRQFSTALATTRMRTDSRNTQAARRVLVEGTSLNAAAKAVGVDIRAVSRAVMRLRPSEECPHCQGTGRIVV